jgi:hypothetical protein
MPQDGVAKGHGGSVVHESGAEERTPALLASSEPRCARVGVHGLRGRLVRGPVTAAAAASEMRTHFMACRKRPNSQGVQESPPKI